MPTPPPGPPPAPPHLPQGASPPPGEVPHRRSPEDSPEKFTHPLGPPGADDAAEKAPTHAPDAKSPLHERPPEYTPETQTLDFEGSKPDELLPPPGADGSTKKRPISYPWGPEAKLEVPQFNTAKRFSDPPKPQGLRGKTQVKPFTKESLERLEKKTVQLVREYGFQPRRKLSVEDGSRLPAKYEPFPSKLYGRPLEEIDNFIYDEVNGCGFGWKLLVFENSSVFRSDS